MSTGLAVLLFVVGAAALVRIGTALAVAGDELAEQSRLGRLFIGTLLVAFATSLPEVATDVTAAVNDAPDLAVGDLFGSSMANMAILAIIDLRHRGRVWPAAELGHARVAAVAMVLTAIAALAMLTPPGLSVGWVGFDTVLIAGLYVAAMAWLRRAPLPLRGSAAGDPPLLVPLQEPVGLAGEHRAGSRRGAMVRFALAALGILVAAPVVALSAKQIADASGVEETFIGTTLLAVTTSLPELVVALAAVRIGAHDLAVGNLFGSNAANMAVLLVLDIAYLDGPILAAVDPLQTTAAVGAMLLMALAVAALVGGTETRIRRLEPDAVMLLVAYVGAIVAVALAA
ncbi:MAG: sodium:calcium antiporter [Acidimicrobiia bacterium]